MKKISKDKMLEDMLLYFKYAVAEYDLFYNRYHHVKVEPIRRVYEKLKEGKYKTRYELENALEEIKHEKWRLLYNNS